MSYLKIVVDSLKDTFKSLLSFSMLLFVIAIGVFISFFVFVGQTIGTFFMFLGTMVIISTFLCHIKLKQIVLKHQTKTFKNRVKKTIEKSDKDGVDIPDDFEFFKNIPKYMENEEIQKIIKEYKDNLKNL